MCPIFVIKFSGVSDLQGVKVPDFPLTLLVILTTVLRYRAACDIINCIRYYCLSYKQCIRGWKFIPIKIRAIPIPIPIQGDFHSFPCIPFPLVSLIPIPTGFPWDSRWEYEIPFPGMRIPFLWSSLVTTIRIVLSIAPTLVLYAKRCSRMVTRSCNVWCPYMS